MPHQSHDPEENQTGDGIGMPLPVELPHEFGRYRILDVLGQGGMGRVYLAKDSVLQRNVALKIPVLKKNDPVVIQRFYREARAMASVHHPNLCPVFDVGEFEGHHYFTMACLEGHPLSLLLKARLTIPEREAAAIIRQLALAVNHLHQAGIVHHDLKPSNVMITPTGQPIVMDFGLARHTDITDSLDESTATIQGSPAYMSPEQAEGRLGDVSPQTDVYSLGVILYELLIGRRPFEGPLLSVVMQIIECAPPRLNADRQRVSDELEEVCLRALSKRPSDRHANAGLLAIDLERTLKRQTEREAAFGSSTARSTVSADPGLPAGSLNQSDDDEFHSIAIDFLAASHSRITLPPRQRTSNTPSTRVIRRSRFIGWSAPGFLTHRSWLLAGLLLLALGTYAGIRPRWLPRPDEPLPSPTQSVDNAPSTNQSGSLKNGSSVADSVSDPGRRATRNFHAMSPADIARPAFSRRLPPPPAPTTESSADFSDGRDAFGHAEASLVSLADVDGDGDLDAYVGYPDGTPDEIWVNHGDGRFTDSGQRLDSGRCINASFGDIDGDGDFDVFTSMIAESGSTCRLLLNDGAGRFAAGTRALPTKAGPIQSHVLDDLDSDGDLDVLIFGGAQAVVWRNDGSGHLHQTGGFLTLKNTRLISSATVGDMNHDGDPDIYFSCFPSSPDQLWLGRGECTFADSGQRASVRGTYSAALADIDGDGDLDGFGVPLAGSPHLVWNDGSGRLGIATAPRVMLYSKCCAAVDLDADRDVDLVFSGNSGASFILRNNGQFADSPASIDLTGHLQPLGDRDCSSLACGDVDGDGDVDILRVTTHDPPVRVHFNLNSDESAVMGNRLYARTPVTLHPAPSQSIIGADFDGDGDVDLLQTTSDGSLAGLWTNAGDGALHESEQLALSRVCAGTALDIDGDGDLDVAVCCLTEAGQLLRNDGTGHFDIEDISAIPEGSTYACVMRDSEGGRPGLVVSGLGRPWEVRQQDDQENFPLTWRSQSTAFINRMAVGDVNADGQQDLVVSFPAEKLCRVFVRSRADPSGKAPFLELSQIPVDGRHFLTPLLGDVDGDGDLDLWIAGRTDQLLLNDGNGSFTATSQSLDSVESSFGVMHDLDRDGDLDVVVANRFGNQDSVWLNDSTGQFHHHMNLPAATASTSIAVADLNGDGWQDLIVASESPGRSHIWFHTGITGTSAHPSPPRTSHFGAESHPAPTPAGGTPANPSAR